MTKMRKQTLRQNLVASRSTLFVLGDVPCNTEQDTSQSKQQAECKTTPGPVDRIPARAP